MRNEVVYYIINHRVLNILFANTRNSDTCLAYVNNIIFKTVFFYENTSISWGIYIQRKKNRMNTIYDKRCLHVIAIYYDNAIFKRNDTSL